MPAFTYEAIDSTGQKVSREVTASSKDDALKQIRSQGLRPTRIAVKPKSRQEAAAKKKTEAE